MTYPKSLKSTKTLMLAEIMFLICEFFIILTAGATSVVYLFAEQLGERLSGFLLIVIYGSALSAIVIKVVGYILCLVSSRRASAEDDNFKVSFYSIILTLLIITASTVFVLNKEVQSISDLLVTLTALLADVYILEGLRSLCKQLDHPEMDKRGGIIYAVITTFFSRPAAVCIFWWSAARWQTSAQPYLRSSAAFWVSFSPFCCSVISKRRTKY